MRKIAVIFFIIIGLCGCRKGASVLEWVDSGREVNENFADVFWLTGTMIDEERDSDGNIVYNISQTEEQKAIYGDVSIRTRNKLFPDSLNFFSPYYHQYTMASINLTPAQFDSLCRIVGDDAYAHFHYYMQHLNNGRPYILAGMSQGGQMVCEVLKRMTDEEFSLMKAAYSIGFGLSSEDLECKHIVPAKGEFDKGVTISYNSVASYDGIWPLVFNDSQAIINPVNWKTDSSPASFVCEGDTLTVRIDSLYKVLMVEGLSDFEKMQLDADWVEDNLHLCDTRIYAPFIVRNVLDRAYR